jgi:hypothetical protein
VHPLLALEAAVVVVTLSLVELLALAAVELVVVQVKMALPEQLILEAVEVAQT